MRFIASAIVASKDRLQLGKVSTGVAAAMVAVVSVRWAAVAVAENVGNVWSIVCGAETSPGMADRLMSLDVLEQAHNPADRIIKAKNLIIIKPL
jgi:hypothetical protein